MSKFFSSYISKLYIAIGVISLAVLVGIIMLIVQPKKNYIVGYSLSTRESSVTDAQLQYLTHINFAFIRPSASGDGSLRPFKSAEKLTSLVSAAHAKGKKVLISVGGYWDNGDDSDFERLAASPTSRMAFAKNLKDFMEQYNLDGIDVDWEYPEAGDKYYEVIREIRKAIGKDKLLTAAVGGDGTSGSGVTRKAIRIMDFINIMAYDHDEGTGHSTYGYAQRSLKYWGAKTWDNSKLILGVPFYSRPGEFSYNAMRSDCSADADTCVYGGTTQYYNGRPTLRSKIDLMRSKGGGGIMIWEISQDTPATSSDSLLRLIAECFHF